MSTEILTIPCLSDNYAFLVHNQETGETALVDAPEAAPIISQLEKRGWSLDTILITHHHHDHVGGVEELRGRYRAKVIGGKSDAHRLPPLDHALSGGDEFILAGLPAEAIDVSGHTVGHIAIHVAAAKAVFTADSLMALGCGRLFEGTASQMWGSLSRLSALPPDTLVYSGHEYTATNARFALTVDPTNPALQARALEVKKARAEGTPTVPSLLSVELATNPFLRPSDQAIRAHLGMADAPDADVFGEIRRLKDSF